MGSLCSRISTAALLLSSFWMVNGALEKTPGQLKNFLMRQTPRQLVIYLRSLTPDELGICLESLTKGQLGIYVKSLTHDQLWIFLKSLPREQLRISLIFLTPYELGWWDGEHNRVRGVTQQEQLEYDRGHARAKGKDDDSDCILL